MAVPRNSGFHRVGATLLVAVLALAVAAGGLAQSAPVRIVALGASNTEGFGVSTWEAYPAQLQVLLGARGVAAEVVNAGLSGDTTAGMLARLDAFLLEGTHLLILQPGTNDARYGLAAETSGNVAKIERRLDERRACWPRWGADEFARQRASCSDNLVPACAGMTRIRARAVPS